MAKLFDLVGQRFARLVVVSRAENDASGHPRWVCRCECSKEVTVREDSLRSRHTRSCGCISRGPNPVVHRPDGVSVITLTRRSGEIVECLIDTKDYALVSNYHWHAAKRGKKVQTFYAATRPRNGVGLMHRLILGLTDPEQEADHINHSGVDNRRSNLRVATRGQNIINRRKKRNCSSGFRGVSWDNRKNDWLVQIKKDGKKHHVGRFTSELEAAQAYDNAARELHGAFALLNFPQTTPVAA